MPRTLRERAPDRIVEMAQAIQSLRKPSMPEGEVEQRLLALIYDMRNRRSEHDRDDLRRLLEPMEGRASALVVLR